MADQMIYKDLGQPFFGSYATLILLANREAPDDKEREKQEKEETRDHQGLSI